MIHRGVQYTVLATAEPDVWEWRYEFDNQIKRGKTQTRLAALAARRVKSKIDVALRSGSHQTRSLTEQAGQSDSASHRWS